MKIDEFCKKKFNKNLLGSETLQTIELSKWVPNIPESPNQGKII